MGDATDRQPPLNVLDHRNYGELAVALERFDSGRARALELILGGRNIDAATAERYGVINRALPDRDLDEYVDTLAARIAEFDSVALEHAKAAIDRRYLPPLTDFQLDVVAFGNLLRSPETSAVIRDALAAGLQTRGPYEYDFGN